MKILIVDDCRTTRKLLTLYLQTKGYDVVSAENGLDAIEKLGRETINLIVTDLNMPYMDGLELVKVLRSDPLFSEMPILMVTTEADPEEREKALQAGADGYLVKPVTADTISVQIRHVLKNIFVRGGSDA